jgi:hypothetical protein
MSLNTSLIFPLSGQTIFNTGGTTTTYNVTGPGIVYLTGIFSTLTQTVLITLNTKQITFTGTLYVPVYVDENVGTSAGTATLKYPKPVSTVVNLLDTSSSSFRCAAGFSGSASATTPPAVASPVLDTIPGAPTDRNKGPYLPVKSGDVFIFGGTAASVGSFLYF